ncbi:DUF7168 domain-containing protein [Inquilinus limosus]|uniref:DUF7168 domain-containing protein n=1 Tax=Inquilinus limosus TaxID=171674 RepID=UPI00068B2D83|nr:DUF2786 domain-containing protein [Inquilinus limosus]
MTGYSPEHKGNLEALRGKLEALRRMTVENGCSEAEAAAAADKMAEILAKHGLSEADLDAMAMADHRERLLKRRSPIDRIWGAVADFARCVSYTDLSPDQKREVVYYGREADVLVAEYVHDVIARAVADARRAFMASPEYRRRRTARTRSAALRAFEEGLAERLRQSLWAGLWRRYPDPPSIAAKTIVARRNALWAQLSGQLHLRDMRPLAKSKARYTEAKLAGAAAGAAITIEAGVGTATAPVTGLLQ